MKPGLIPGLVVLSGMLCVTNSSAHAQNPAASARSAKAVASVPDDAVSVTAHLQMSSDQIERFDRLYDSYSARRAKQENELGRFESELQVAQSPASFNEKQASRLLRDIGKAQQNLANDWLGTRVKALAILTPVQRAQLGSLANDTRLRWREDSYSWLLLSQTDSIGSTRFENELGPTPHSERVASKPRRRSDNRGRSGQGSYGVYGGYGYGQPQFGVYGNYGQGPVGVYGGLGRGGPSIGVGIGGVFSGRIFGR